MQPLGAIFLGVATALIGQVSAPPASPSVDAALARYDRLPAESRARWAQEMLVRLDRAGALVLTEEEAAEQQERTAKFARLLDRGYRPPRSSIRNLLVELEQREGEAVERLARRYRLQIYRTFRQEGKVYGRRRAAWDKVEGAWKSAGGPGEQRPQLIDWLVVATYRSTPGTIGALPGVPDFRPAIGRPTGFPGLIAGDVQQPESALPEAILRPALEPRRPAAATGPPEQPADPMHPTPPADDWLLAQPVQPDMPTPGHEGAARVADRGQFPVRRPGEAVPPVSRTAPQPDEPEAVPAADPRELATVRSLRPPSGVGQVPIEPLEPPGEDRPQTDWLVPHPKHPAERRQAGEPVQRAPTAAGQPVRREFDAPAGTGAEPTPEPLIAANHPRGGPWPDFPEEPLAKPATEPRTSTTEPPDPARTDAEAGAQHGVQVNLGELSAGIAGANLALRAMEAELDNDEVRPSARRIASLVRRLEILVLRHDDLALFCELIGPAARGQVGPLASPRAMIPRLAEKTFAARTYVSGNEFTGTPADREFELELLGEMSRKLAQLAEKP